MTPRRQLLFAGHKVAVEIQAWLRANGQHKVVYNITHFKLADQLRLLRFRTWSLVYKVDIGEILDIVVPVLRSYHSSYRPTGRGLGMTLGTLTGKMAEDVLRKELERRYPQNENVEVWREEERDRQLYAERMEELDGAAPRETVRGTMQDAALDPGYVDRYAKVVLAARERLRKEQDARWRTRKSYRGNPWIR